MVRSGIDLSGRKLSAGEAAIAILRAKEIMGVRGIAPDEYLLHRLAEIIKPQTPEEFTKSAIATQRYKKALESWNGERVGKFRVVQSSDNSLHWENPIELQVRNSRDQPVGSVGFYVQVTPDGNELHISSIQGVPKKGRSLAALTKKLGENWRVVLAKRLQEHARKRGMDVVGVLPLYWNRRNTDPWEYMRQVRQYKNTFKRARITKTDDRLVVMPKQEELDRWRPLREKRRATHRNRVERG